MNDKAKPNLTHLVIVVISELTGVESAYEIPDVLWDRISSLLPLRKCTPLLHNSINNLEIIKYELRIYVHRPG